MKITDAVALLDGARVTDSGYLEANARTARTGVQAYLGIEVGRPDLSLVNVYRDETAVFSKAALETFSKLPITVDHPPVMVDATNWGDYAVGTTGDDVLRDGEFLKIGLKITDAAAVAAVQSGKRELSVGYTTMLVFEDGIAADGTPYQARQTDIRANHIAIVDRGRAGSEVRIGDGAVWGARPLADAWTIPATEKEPVMTTRTIMVDGLSVELTDKDAQIVQRAVDALARQVADANAATDAAKAAHDKAIADAAAESAKALAAKDATIADKDKALAGKDAEIDALKGQVLDAAALDKRVADRADLIAKAKMVAPKVETTGLSDAAIRKAAVALALGDAAITGKADAYIDARFDILVEDRAKADPVAAAALAAPATPIVDTRDSAHAAMVARMVDAYQQEAKH